MLIKIKLTKKKVLHQVEKKQSEKTKQYSLIKFYRPKKSFDWGEQTPFDDFLILFSTVVWTAFIWNTLRIFFTVYRPKIAINIGVKSPECQSGGKIKKIWNTEWHKLNSTWTLR